MSRELVRLDPCTCCGRISKRFKTMEAAIMAWNTRAPILSAEEMEMLEGME